MLKTHLKPTWTGLAVIVAFFAIMGVLSPQAQDPPGVSRIGFVDKDKIISSSKHIQAAFAELKTQVEANQEKLDQIDGKFRRLAEELKTQASILSAAEKSTREKELEKLKTDAEYIVFQNRKLTEGSSTQAFRDALDKVMNAIDQIGREGKYDLILDGDSVLFGAQALNLTDVVINRLDNEAAPAAAPAGKPRSAKELGIQ